MKQSLYDLLQVSSKAEADVIDAAYLRLREKLEARSGPDAVNELKFLQMAYETLADPMKRVRYDQELAVASRSLAVAAATERTVSVARTELPPPEALNTFLEWWSSPKMTVLVTAAIALIGLGLYLNYSKEDKRTAVSNQKTSNEKLKIERVDAGRVENERMLVDRVTNSIDKEIEYSKDLASRSLDMRQEQLEHARRQADQRLDMQRRAFEQQQESMAQSRQRTEEARRRHEEAQAAAAAQSRLERDRAELCRMERDRYGRAISCPY